MAPCHMCLIPGTIGCLPHLHLSPTIAVEYKILDNCALCLYIYYKGFHIPILN